MAGSKSHKFAWMDTNFSTLVLVSLLHAMVCVFPNKDQLCSEAADVGGIWMVMEATGERASDPQSPFYQVADEICWHDCHIASPSQKPLLGSVLRQTAKILDLIQAKVARHGSDDTIGLVDLCTRQDALASILGSNMYAAACMGFRQKSSHF